VTQVACAGAKIGTQFSFQSHALPIVSLERSSYLGRKSDKHETRVVRIIIPISEDCVVRLKVAFLAPSPQQVFSLY
jgi:hypothetical protein